MELSYSGRVGQWLQTVGTGLRDLDVMDTANGPVVVASSGGAGGMMSVAIDESGQAQLLDSLQFSPALSAAVEDDIALVTSAGLTRVVVGRSGSDTALGFQLHDSGGFGPRADLSGSGLAVAGTQLQQVAGDFVFLSGDDGVLRCFRLTSGTTLDAGPSVSDTPDTYHASPQTTATVSLPNQSFLLTACAQDTGVSLFAIDPVTGVFSHSAALTPALGLGLHEVPVAIETAEVAGRAYAVIASASAQGNSAALSVVEITAQGRMVVTDHILDSLNTRFGRVTGVDTATINGQTFVAAAGGDQGVSLFALIPGGRLVHLHSMAGTLQAGLNSLSDIALVARQGGLHVLAADQTETGLVHLSADGDIGMTRVAGLAGETVNGSDQDDILVGGGGRDRLWGGDGDDILTDGLGRDTLFGGAGSDRFVLEADGETDQIRDFDPGADRLDLSLIPFLYSAAQVQVIPTGGGARLLYRGETLDIRSASGQGLSQAEVLGAMVWDVDRPPLVLRQSIDGSAQGDRLEGSAGQDLIRGYSGDDRLAGLEGEDEIEGGAGRDTLFGGPGADLIRGGPGRDEVHLGAGNDVFEDEAETGAAGRDTIYAGTGDDTVRALGGDDIVFGGDGRDSVTLGAGNDLFNDNAQGGTAGRDTVFGGDGDDTVQGGNGDDAFHGEWGNDVILGRLGNDSLYGGFGFDSLYAGQGDDVIWAGDGRDLAFLGTGNDVFFDTDQAGENGRDTVYSGAGDDRVEGGAGHDLFFGDDGNDILNGRKGHDTIYGGASFDTIYGGEGDDRIWGGNGRDLVFMGPGRDLYSDNAQGGDLGRDHVFAGAGHDTIEGGNGNDTFLGEAGDDLIRARLGDDMLYGGAGRDTLEGGAGDDAIWGGAGADTFIFRRGDGRDDIYTFDPAQDRLLLDPVLWGGDALSPALIVTLFGASDGTSATLAFAQDQIELHGLASHWDMVDALDFL